MYKKLLFTVFLSLFMVLLVACGGSDSTSSEESANDEETSSEEATNDEETTEKKSTRLPQITDMFLLSSSMKKQENLWALTSI